jgi:hypothetical protein
MMVRRRFASLARNLAFIVLLAQVVGPASITAQDCGEGAACASCHCVGYCDCLFQLYYEPCDPKEEGEDPCIVLRRTEIDGTEENCQYVCCSHEEWDCDD